MVSYKINEEKREIKCVLIDRSFGVIHKSVGIARCNPEDVWDVEAGKNLAFNRARRAEIGHNYSRYQAELEALDHEYTNIREALVRKLERQKKAIEVLRKADRN